MDFLVNELRKYKIIYTAIQDQTSFDKICNLFCHEIFFEPQNTIEYLYVAIYYGNVKKNHAKAKHYYLMSINKGNPNAMNNLAMLYEIKEKNVKAEHYYKMAIEKGSIVAMNHLANLYYARNDYKIAKHYYLMAIECNNASAMNGLAIYYYDVKQKIKKAEHYFLMAINCGNITAMCNYAFINIKRDFTKAISHYLMAIEKGERESILILADIYLRKKDYTNAEKFFNMAIDNNCINAIDKSFEFHENYLKNQPKLLKFCIEYNKQLERKKVINVIKSLWNSKLDYTKHFMKLLLVFKFLVDDDIPTLLKIFSNLLHQKINIMHLHFEFSINGRGYMAAKQDFDKIVNT